MLKQQNDTTIYYEIVEEKENPAETLIRKHGMVSEFTLGEINVDLSLLAKKKNELESQIAVEAARMTNIDRTNPEIGQMEEAMRQVVFIYERAFAFVKIAKQKVAEIDAQAKEYREEVVRIAMETGLNLKSPEEKAADEANATGKE